MSNETKLHLAQKFRENWYSQYPYFGRNDNVIPQPNILKHINRNVITSMPECASQNAVIIDDSLTNLNWLQNLNLFSMPHCQAPLSPSPGNYYHSTPNHMTPIVNTTNLPNRVTHPFFESNGLYAEVAHNLEFMNQEASAHFFKVNNQLRPPFSDINLISMAIFSYNKVKVSFPEICQWIEETFPYYKIINQDWKVGIKNHLTLSKCFQKVPRKKDEAEKGGFWRFSNDFLSYLEKSRLMSRNVTNIAINVQQENANQFDYRYGKLIPRKRPISSIGLQDENINSLFKTPIKKANICNNEFFLGLSCFDQLMEQSPANQVPNSYIIKSEDAIHYFNNSIISNPMIPNITTNSFGNISLLKAASNTSQLTQIYDQSNPFQHNVDCMNLPVAIENDSNTYPEQVTEEEFLSGRLFNSNYLSSQSNIENLPTLLDSQVNFNASDNNIHDLSITGIGLRAPEWWNQSLSASQISISKLGCSLRSLASIGNVERGSPYCEDDHHIVWQTDQNLEELDIIFGLS